MDYTILSASHIPSAVTKCLYGIQNATGHGDVESALLRLASYLVLDAGGGVVCQTLAGTDWQTTLDRLVGHLQDHQT